MKKVKEEIIEHHLKAIGFVSSLSRLSEKEWRTPIAEDKWTIAEIIGHFKPWDEFVMTKRLPYLFSEDKLPKGPDSNEINSRSAALSRQEPQQTTIEKFISTRKNFLKAVKDLPDHLWEQPFSIGQTTLTLYDYLHGLAEHDRHHFEQITETIPSLKE
ncbi:DinB family protein [Salipaludibacillus aurantiacus]|uniref:DinB superfamily protein n=1 Tax=Salipaludibacillus aurantiacus TaxID=1601833 RepID=A0A1H9Q8L1_9BACI|nr:DinB family protein [Salipaludibacillus aurantiacus]SER56757.1 DinB superfamily protein [Salipaludibacillus aurantiacus]